MDYQKEKKAWSDLHYNWFSVGSAIEKYPLTVGGFTEEGRDPFAYHNGIKFSAPDNNNDHWNTNCAEIYKSRWWHKDYSEVNINTQLPTVNVFVLLRILRSRAHMLA